MKYICIWAQKDNHIIILNDNNKIIFIKDEEYIIKKEDENKFIIFSFLQLMQYERNLYIPYFQI